MDRQSSHDKRQAVTARKCCLAVLFMAITAIGVVTFLPRSPSTAVEVNTDHTNLQPLHLLTCQSFITLPDPKELSDKDHKLSPTSSDFVYKFYYTLEIIDNRVLIFFENSFLSENICSRNRSIYITFCARGVKRNALLNDYSELPDGKGDPNVTESAGNGWIPMFCLYKSWRHMFSHPFYLFNGTGTFQPRTFQPRSCIRTCWAYIANVYHYLLSAISPYHYLLSAISPYNSSYFLEIPRHYITRCDLCTLLKAIVGVVVLTGLYKLGAWRQSPKPPRRYRVEVKTALSYGQREHCNKANLKSGRFHLSTRWLDSVYDLLRSWPIQSRPGFEHDINDDIDDLLNKKTGGFGDENDADGWSCLKPYYTSPTPTTAMWRGFRPQPVQIHVAPIQQQQQQQQQHQRQEHSFLPTPTLNPDIDLAYPGYRIATLGALPASFPVSRFRLAEAGFYFRGEGDEMVCYSCGARRSGWTSGEDPMALHRSLNSQCRHVVAKDNELLDHRPAAANSTPVADGDLGGGRGSDRRPPPSTASSSSSSAHRTSSSPAANGTGAHTARAASRIDDTASDGVVANGHAGGSQPAATSGAVYASQPVSASSRPSRASRTVPETSTVPSSDAAAETPLFPRPALDLGGAVYPMYQDTASRRRSFEQCRWDDSQAPPLDEIIMSGMFYAGYADCVRCFYCGVGLKHWMASDDVWTEHVRWRPHCGYLRIIRSEEFITNIQRQLDNAGSGGTQGVQRPGFATPVGDPRRPLASTSTSTRRTATPAAPAATTTTTTTTSGSRTRQTTSARATTNEPSAGTSTARRPAATASGMSSPGTQTATSQARVSVPQTQTPTTTTTTPSSAAPVTGRATPTTTTSSGSQSTPGQPRDSAPQTQSSTSSPASPAAATAGSRTTAPASSSALPQAQRPGTPSSRNSPGGGPSANAAATTSVTSAGPAGQPATASQSAGGGGPRRSVDPGGEGISNDGPGGAGAGAGGHSNRGDARGGAVASDAAPSDLERREHLQEENRRLSQRFQCRVCRENPVNAILLPCGHVVACEPCAQSLTSCPLCQAVIRATARVHFA